MNCSISVSTLLYVVVVPSDAAFFISASVLVLYMALNLLSISALLGCDCCRAKICACKVAFDVVSFIVYSVMVVCTTWYVGFGLSSSMGAPMLMYVAFNVSYSDLQAVFAALTASPVSHNASPTYCWFCGDVHDIPGCTTISYMLSYARNAFVHFMQLL